MPSLSERTLMLSAGKTAKGLAYLAFSVGTARLYPLADYAAFQTWWAVYMLLVPIAEGGFTASLYHALPRLSLGERNGHVWRTFVALTGLGAAAALLTMLLAEPLAKLFHLPAAAAQLRAVAPFIGAALPTFAFQAWLLVEGRTGAIAVLDILGALSTGAGLLLPALFGVEPQVGLYLLSAYGIVRTAVLAVWLRRKLHPRVAAGGLTAQLRYASHVSSSRAMGVATKQLDRFFVGAYADPRAFSVYATGALEIPVINILTGSAATVLSPEISKRFHVDDRAGALQLWHESIRKISLLLFPIGVATAVLADPLFTALYGAKLADAALVYQIFALALPLRAAQYGAVLLAAGETHRVVTGSLVGLATNVALCLWWVPRWAGAGAAAAGVISVYAVVAVYLQPLSRLFACRIAGLFPWGALGRIALACVPAAAAAWALPMLMTTGAWPKLIAGSAAFGLAVLPAALLTGAVRKDDRARLGRILEKRHA